MKRFYEFFELKMDVANMLNEAGPELKIFRGDDDEDGPKYSINKEQIQKKLQKLVNFDDFEVLMEAVEDLIGAWWQIKPSMYRILEAMDGFYNEFIQDLLGDLVDLRDSPNFNPRFENLLDILFKIYFNLSHDISIMIGKLEDHLEVRGADVQARTEAGLMANRIPMMLDQAEKQIKKILMQYS